MIRTIRQAFALLDRGSRPWLYAHVAASTLGAFLEASGLGLVFVFFHAALEPGDFSGIPPVHWLYVELGQPARHQFLAVLALIVVAAFVLRSVMLLAAHWIGYAMRRQVQCALSASLFRDYLAQPLVWHVRRGASRLLNNVGGNIGTVMLHLVVGALEVVGAVAMMLFLLATMGWLRPVETLVACVGLGSIGFLYLRLLGSRLSQWGQLRVVAAEAMLRSVREPLRGIKTVKVAGLEEHFARRVDASVKDLMDVNLRQGMVQQAPRYVMEVLLVGGVLIAVAVGFTAGQTAADIVPTMALFAAAAVRLLPQITKILLNVQQFRYAEAALRTLREDLTDLAGQDRPRLTAPVRDAVGGDFSRLALRGVSFAYPGADRPAVHDISMELGRGEHVALVGLSGAGKTTLADMLLGLVEPDSGTLLLDGRPTRRFPLSLFAYVPQDPFIVGDTLRRNIALGAADEAVDEAALRRAVAGAALEPVVARLPQGLDTVLSEDGGGLSGGEKQRLGLARALYSDAEVLVLDEPTSALDALTEAEVSATIGGLRGRKTVVLVAHRLSTIKAFDRILFMEGGRIAASGRFGELYAGNQRFRTMVDFLSVTTEGVIDGGPVAAGAAS